MAPRGSTTSCQDAGGRQTEMWPYSVCSVPDPSTERLDVFVSAEMHMSDAQLEDMISGWYPTPLQILAVMRENGVDVYQTDTFQQFQELISRCVASIVLQPAAAQPPVVESTEAEAAPHPLVDESTESEAAAVRRARGQGRGQLLERYLASGVDPPSAELRGRGRSTHIPPQRSAPMQNIRALRARVIVKSN